MDIQVLQMREHQLLPDFLRASGFDFPIEMWYPKETIGKSPYLFNIDRDGRLGYFIGLDWLKEHEIAIDVVPKIEHLDYMQMFSVCLTSRKMLSYLGGIYSIEVDRPFIKTSRPYHEINTIIALHYLKLLQDLTLRPLMRGYIQRNENLTAKVKGKIDLPNHLRANILGSRPDRVFCKYQEYSIDCLENRLLNSSFDIALSYLSSQKHTLPDTLQQSVPAIRQVFSPIGRLNSFTELQRIKSNPIYREYAEAIRLAKILFKIKGYQHDSNQPGIYLVPPFSINMPLLFEMYVLNQLSELPNSQILAQEKVSYGSPDFLDLGNQLIVDAKYKTRYKDPDVSSIIEDIRQLSGYARDKGVHKALGLQNPQFPIKCVIIYPENAAQDSLKNYESRLEPIHGFQEFYKVGIRLPEKPPVNGKRVK